MEGYWWGAICGCRRKEPAWTITGQNTVTAKCSAVVTCFLLKLYVCTVVPKIKNKRRGCKMYCSMVISSCYLNTFVYSRGITGSCEYDSDLNYQMLLHHMPIALAFIWCSLDIKILITSNIYCCWSLQLLIEMQYLHYYWLNIIGSTLLVSCVHNSIWNSIFHQDWLMLW